MRATTNRWARLRPRGVRDSIPSSRLAQIFNFEYDEARELSYAPAAPLRIDRLYETFSREDVSEPWMLEDIDDLLVGFLTYRDQVLEVGNCNENHENLPCSNDFCEMSFESPLMETNNFDEMALKLKIVSDNIKRIWDTKFFPYYGWHPVTKAKNLILFRSPACQIFSSVKDEMDDADWLQNLPETEGSLSQIKALTQSFKEQNTWIFKKQNSSRSWLDSSPDTVDLSTHRRLYSAVLQGTAQNQPASPRELMVNLQFGSAKNRDSSQTIDTSTETSDIEPPPGVKYATDLQSPLKPAVDQSAQLNIRTTNANSSQVSSGQQCYSYYTSRSTVQTTASSSTPPVASVFSTPTNYTNYQYLPQSNNYFGPRLYANNYVANNNVLNFRQTNYFPLVLQNTAPYPQTSFFNYPRSTFPSYGRAVVYPQRPPVVVPSPGWFLQQPVKITQPTVNLLATRTPIQAPTYHYRCPSTVKLRPTKSSASSNLNIPQVSAKDDLINQEMESIVAKTVSAVLDEPDNVPDPDDPESFVPITCTPSDELELQALEQYSPSNDNMFQELERQAEEQYERSENWKSPPSCDDIIGGLIFSLLKFKCLDEILGLVSSDTIKGEVSRLMFGRS